MLPRSTFGNVLSSTPSVESLKKAMQTYARQGGTSTIFINDDGMQVGLFGIFSRIISIETRLSLRRNVPHGKPFMLNIILAGSPAQSMILKDLVSFVLDVLKRQAI